MQSSGSSQQKEISRKDARANNKKRINVLNSFETFSKLGKLKFHFTAL